MVHAQITSEGAIWQCEVDLEVYVVDDDEPMLSADVQEFIREHSEHARLVPTVA